MEWGIVLNFRFQNTLIYHNHSWGRCKDFVQIGVNLMKIFYDFLFKTHYIFWSYIFGMFFQLYFSNLLWEKLKLWLDHQVKVGWAEYHVVGKINFILHLSDKREEALNYRNEGLRISLLTLFMSKYILKVHWRHLSFFLKKLLTNWNQHGVQCLGGI